MKKIKCLYPIIILCLFFSFISCGPVIISSRPSQPPPPWFYPHRVESVRYVYFPEFSIYYDLTLRHYTYFDNGVWLNANVLPPRFNIINFRNTRQIRINNYFGDNIREFHPKNTYVKGRRTTTESNSRRSSTDSSRRN
jgi:hypothetical protein